MLQHINAFRFNCPWIHQQPLVPLTEVNAELDCDFFEQAYWTESQVADELNYRCAYQYNDIMMSAMASQTTDLTIVYSRANNPDNVSIWCRHHFLLHSRFINTDNQTKLVTLTFRLAFSLPTSILTELRAPEFT